MQFVFQHFNLNACKLSDHLSTAIFFLKAKPRRNLATCKQISLSGMPVNWLGVVKHIDRYKQRLNILKFVLNLWYMFVMELLEPQPITFAGTKNQLE